MADTKRTIPNEPHSLGRYAFSNMTLAGVESGAATFDIQHKRDDLGAHVLFYDGHSYWMVPLMAGVPALKLNIDEAK